MALPNESLRSFRLYVTHVGEDGHFLKISGQLDQRPTLLVKSLFDAARDDLENGVGSVTPSAIQEGMICAAKYKDGTYYRAKIINTRNLSAGFVGVHFIDYGIKDFISLGAIRCLDKYDPMFLHLPGQATDYCLARIMHPSGRWDNQLLFELQSLLGYQEHPVRIEGQSTIPIISIQFKGTDFSMLIVSNQFGIAVAVTKQELMMLERFQHQPQQHPGIGNQQGMWQQSSLPESPSYAEHVPFLVNQNFPANPASAMRLQQHATVPFNGAVVPPPSAISQRLIVNKSVKSSTYKSRKLEINSQYKVYVSFAEEGPVCFAVQLTQDAKELQHMMDEINKRPHSSLAEPPMIGTVCLGRMSVDRIICRAIVVNLSDSQCKLFFVDFGDTEMVSYYDIFDIPEEFVTPNVFAMRFCLSGLKKLEKGPYLNEAFKQLVTKNVMTLRVMAPEGPPLIQYGELYLDGTNVLDLLMANMKDKLQFKWMEMLPLGSKFSVLVSYVDSCLKFYIQVSDQIDALNDVMDAVQAHCESTSSPGELPLGAACCARFPDDGNWYRARIRGTKGVKFIVAYVDYGNKQEVEVSDLRTITPDLIKIPAQALKCALKGFESKPVETKTSNQLQMLALGKTLTAKILGVLSSDTMLVSLVDDTVSPPLDVARKINQLSQPRSNTEIKPSAPASKAAPEPYSSPEGNVPGDNRRFKEEGRPPREGNDEIAQRGGRCRNRENREPFDRSGLDTVESLEEDLIREKGGAVSLGRSSWRRRRPPTNRRKSPRRRRGSTSATIETTVTITNEAAAAPGRTVPIGSRDKELSDPVPLETPFADLTVDSGAQHEVSVTWIISPHNFYTQILSLQPQFLKMMHTIPELYRGVKSYTGPVPLGASVLARFPDDGVLYRATVVAVQPFSKYNVQYVDFGNKQLVDAKDIWQLDSQLMELPKMAIPCSLVGVAPKDGEWKANPEIDLCFNAPRYQCVFQECVEGLYHVSLWNNGASVVDMLAEKQLVALSEQQSSVTLKGTPEPLTFEPDTLCAAKSSDENLYRAAIVSATETEAKVQFPYYIGNTETVAKDLVKVLDPSFYKPCAQALVASPGLVALQDSATETDKKVQVTLAFGTDGWLASLIRDVVDLSMKLVEEKLATPRVTPEEVESAPEAEPVSLPPGCTQVYIDTPGHLWLQTADKIEEIQAELKANADSYGDLETREMNTLCVAKYFADDLWYRAEVLGLDSDITTVRFIDYGNTGVLDYQSGVIKEMPEAMRLVKPYAVRSSVNAVPTGTVQWSEPAAESFEALVGDTEAPVDARIVHKDVTTYVDLFVGGRDITDQLVEQGHAARSEQPECGDLPSCFASHVNSPSEFWIQLESAAPELQAMETAMVDAENFPELAAREEGVLCAAKYPEDGAWYRAQVIFDGSEGTEVLFLDYGNASIATELRSLPDELKLKPALSRKCALQKPRDIKSWSRKSKVKFNELAAEGATIFNVQFIASGDISTVELYLEGKSVTEELVGLCEEQPPAERPTPVGQDLHSTGKICYVHATDEFYVHLDDKTPELDKVTEVMCDAPDFEQTDELKVGSICAAFCAEDEQWYRGKILEFCDASFHVQYIDYGNKAKCEEFRQLPAEISAIEALAKCCRLAGVDTAAASAASRRLDHLMANDTPFHIEFLDSTKDPALVKLLIDGEDINATIVTSKPSEAETEETVSASLEAVANSTKESIAFSQLSERQLEETVSEIAISKDMEVAEVNSEKSISETEVVKDIQVAEEEPVSKVAISKDLEVDKDNLEKTESTILENIESSKVATPEKTEQVINKDAESILVVDSENQTNNTTKCLETNLEEDEMFENAKEMNTSQPDIDESLKSNHTDIENKSFEANLDNLNDSDEKTEQLESPKRDTSLETLEDSNETIKTPEREQSKDSIITDDTVYTSNVDVPLKDSPLKESSGESLEKTDTKVTEKLDSVEMKAEDNEAKLESIADVTLKEPSEIIAESSPINNTKVVAEEVNTTN